MPWVTHPTGAGQTHGRLDMKAAGGSPTFSKHRCIHSLLLQTWQRNISKSAWTCPRRRRRGNSALPEGQSCKQPGLGCRRWPWPIALGQKASRLCGPWTWEAWKMHEGWWGSASGLPAPGPLLFPSGSPFGTPGCSQTPKQNGYFMKKHSLL